VPLGVRAVRRVAGVFAQVVQEVLDRVLGRWLREDDKAAALRADGGRVVDRGRDHLGKGVRLEGGLEHDELIRLDVLRILVVLEGCYEVPDGMDAAHDAEG